MSHTKEPWEYFPEEGNCIKHELLPKWPGAYVTVAQALWGGKSNDDNGRRIVQCVNALAGVEEPVAAIQAVRDFAHIVLHDESASHTTHVAARVALRLLGGSQATQDPAYVGSPIPIGEQGPAQSRIITDYEKTINVNVEPPVGGSQ